MDLEQGRKVDSNATSNLRSVELLSIIHLVLECSNNIGASRIWTLLTHLHMQKLSLALNV